MLFFILFFFFFKQKTAYEMRISDWSSDVCSSDLPARSVRPEPPARTGPARRRRGNRRCQADRGSRRRTGQRRRSQGQGRLPQRLTTKPPGRNPSRWQRPDTTHPYTRPGIPEDRQAALFCSNTFAGAASAASSCSSPPPPQAKQHPPPSPPRIPKPILPRQPRQRHPVINPQLLEQPRLVRIDRLRAQAQALGHVFLPP